MIEPITRATMRQTTASLRNSLPDPARAREDVMRDILRKTGKEYGVSVENILGRSHRAVYATPRHIAIHRIREATKASLPAIGRMMGGRDHTTIINSLLRAEQILEGKN